MVRVGLSDHIGRGIVSGTGATARRFAGQQREDTGYAGYFFGNTWVVAP